MFAFLQWAYIYVLVLQLKIKNTLNTVVTTVLGYLLLLTFSYAFNPPLDLQATQINPFSVPLRKKKKRLSSGNCKAFGIRPAFDSQLSVNVANYLTPLSLVSLFV